MGEAETLVPAILPQVQSLVSDDLQVVSFKWLSRNFSVSSNTAKRLLQEFVDRHGEGLEVVYALSGWLKDDPSVYHVKLISKRNLSVARDEFAESCSVHVYSVQTCIPKDSATIWNAEFLQTEGLFNQQSEVRNCLRDNRFGGISNPFVKRDDGDGAASDATVHSHSVNGSGVSSLANVSKLKKASQPLGKFQQTSSSKVHSELSDIKDFKNGTSGPRASAQSIKMSEDKEKVTSSLDHKNMVQDGHGSKQGGSLTSMWGRTSNKRKSDDTMEENRTDPVSADAQICAREAAELSSGDEGCDEDFKKTSLGNGRRKRLVVFDDSDEEDEHLDAVNLGSADIPKSGSFLASKGSVVTLKAEESKLDFGEADKMKLQVEEIEADDVESKQAFGKDISCVRDLEAGASSSGRVSGLYASNINNKVSDPAPSSPTRRKVLRTSIDERGREVTEVVWEGEEATAKNKSATEDKPIGNGFADVASRPPPAKKPQTVVSANPAGKGGKKAGSKDPKQGKIMSFFKRV